MVFYDPATRNPPIFKPENDIPFYYNKICEFYRDAGADDDRQEEHITIQLGLEVARHFRNVYPDNTEKPWLPLTLGSKDAELKNIAQSDPVITRFKIAPSTRKVEIATGIDVVWHFGGNTPTHTYYLQAKRVIDDDKVDFIAPGNLAVFSRGNIFMIYKTRSGGKNTQIAALKGTTDNHSTAYKPTTGLCSKAFGAYIIYGTASLWLVPVAEAHEEATELTGLEFPQDEIKKFLKQKFCVDTYLFDKQFKVPA